MPIGGGLRCAECGCVSLDGRGWVGQTAFDPDDDAPPSADIYCPPCAASRFGYRPDVAESYVCVWPPLPGEPGNN